MEYRTRVADVDVGDNLVMDGGFDCITGGTVVEVKSDIFHGLYFECDAGIHGLNHLLDDSGEYYVGVLPFMGGIGLD